MRNNNSSLWLSYKYSTWSSIRASGNQRARH